MVRVVLLLFKVFFIVSQYLLKTKDAAVLNNCQGVTVKWIFFSSFFFLDYKLTR